MATGCSIGVLDVAIGWLVCLDVPGTAIGCPISGIIVFLTGGVLSGFSVALESQ